MSASTNQQEDQQKKKKTLPFDYTTTDDIFLTAKGKALRNKQKTLDKIIETQKAIKKGEIQPTDAQKEMVSRRESLAAEIKEIKELIDLYIQANPDYKRKGAEEKKEVAVVVPTSSNLEEAFTLLAKVMLLDSFNQKHGGVVSNSGSELSCFTTLATQL